MAMLNLFGRKNRIKKQKRKIARTVQQSIPIDAIYKDGIFRTGRLFSKSWKFSDINYAVASDDDQLQMFLAHSAILNGLPTDAMAEITIYNRQLHNKVFEQITTPSDNPNYRKYTKELNGILCDKMSESNNIVHEKYITVATEKKNIEEARTFFTRVGNDLTADYAKISSKIAELGYKDRLRIFNDFFKTGENEEFDFDLKKAMAKGADFKDYIAPDSLEFKKDYIKIGDKYARTVFLKEYPSFLKDSMISELTDFSRSMMLSITIQPIPTDEAVKIVQKKLLAIETDITKWQQKQNENNNFSANIPYEMEQMRKEIKEFLDDLTTRDQRMMCVTVTLLHIADSLEQLDNDTETLMSIGRKHLCNFATLKYQQEDGMQTVLEMLENKYLEYTKKNNIILGEIYSKLVKVRDKIAGETVYENYAEYAYEIGYTRDYTVAEAQSFSGYVKKHIVHLFEKVGDAIANLDTRYLSMTDEEILEELKFCFADVSSEMSDAFMYMLDKNMYDITYSEDKYPSYAATIYLYNPGTPFLFASPSEDNADQLGTVIHEFGHFNTMLYDPVNQENNIGTFDASNMDTAEVNSLGLETLMTNYYNRFYGKDENAYTLSLIYYLLGNVIDGCVINEFELAAIKNPNMSVDELNRTYRKIGESYGMTFMTDDEMAYGWVRTQHIFTQPFYYISYATSSMAALDIWSGIDDFDVAKDRYLKFCALGDHIPFKEALSEVGIHNVFEEKCSIILAEQITEEFGFDYEDVKHDEWYYNAVFFSLPYVDGLSDVEYGINQNASRGIIATGIAGLCRGENVESKAKFTDIPANNKVYINWAYDNGIIYGYDDTLFGYSDDVTREQAVVMLYRCAEFLGTDNSEASSQIIYTDADAVSDWAVEAVRWASSIGIIRGYEDGTFKPFNNVTKAEFAQMLYAFADVVH